MTTQTRPPGNRLSGQTSPYLLQHADNPVHWQPWGEEAFTRAKAEDKPVFLSVGYSTCHWCHVMERESFEREDVAALLNEHFVSIKVDREERPDVDRIYMNATQLATGRGGWPNSVWLTPEGKPWYAGTYFPPEDRSGMPGFKTVLRRLAELWRTRREEVEAQAEKLTEAVGALSGRSPAGEGGPALSRAPTQAAVEALRASFDRRNGGFGAAPKFPPHGALRLLLQEHRRSRDASLLEMVTETLDGMAEGGIRDHLGGGFHRYATDARWLVPHFEKMLYDNARLARTYAEAFELTGEARYGRIAAETCEWVLREMTDPGGGFHSAVDADSEGEEGKFYLWTREEVLEVLGADEGELFCRVYGVEDGGNFREEASGRRAGRNILHLDRPIEVSAKVEGLAADELRRRLAAAREKLLARRDGRVRPHTDDKVLAGWNGLMIGALGFAGRRCERPDFVAAAERAASFVLKTMRTDGRLRRSWRDGRVGGPAYLDDYAFLADGLLDLHEAGGDDRWRDEAGALMDVLDRHYAAEGGGYYLTSDDHEALLARPASPVDQAVPAGAAVAARALIRLGRVDRAKACLDAAAGLMRQAPQATTSMLLVTGLYLDAVAAGESGRRPAARSARPAVTAEVFVGDGEPAPGETIELRLLVRVDPCWHVYGPDEQGGEVVPTSVRLAAGAGELGEVAWPVPAKVRFAPDGPEVAVYRNVVEVPLPVRIAEDAPPGAAELTFELRAQPCDDRACLAPQTHRLPVTITVRGP